MGVNSLPKTVTQQRRGCDLNPGPTVPESSMLTTRIPSHSRCRWLRRVVGRPRAALTGKHDTLDTIFLPAGRRGPLASRGPYASILPVYQQRDWGPGMVKWVGPTRCLMRPWGVLYMFETVQQEIVVTRRYMASSKLFYAASPEKSKSDVAKSC